MKIKFTLFCLFTLSFGFAQDEQCFENTFDIFPIPPSNVNTCDLSDYTQRTYDRSQFKAVWGYGSPIWKGEHSVINGIPQFSAYKAGWDASTHSAAYGPSVMPAANSQMFRNVEQFITQTILNNSYLNSKYGGNPENWTAISDSDAEIIGQNFSSMYVYNVEASPGTYRPVNYFFFDQENGHAYDNNLVSFTGSVAKGMKSARPDMRITIYGHATYKLPFYAGDPGRFSLNSTNPYSQTDVDAWTINNQLFSNPQIKASEAFIDGNKMYFKVPLPNYQSLYQKNGQNYILDSNGDRLWRNDAVFSEQIDDQTVNWYNTRQYSFDPVVGMPSNIPESQLAVEGIYRVHAMNQLYLMASNHATNGSTNISNHVDRINKLNCVNSLLTENYTYGGNASEKRILPQNQIEWWIKSALFKGFEQIETWENGNLSNGLTDPNNRAPYYSGDIRDVGLPIYPHYNDPNEVNPQLADQNWNRYKVATKAVVEMRDIFATHPKDSTLKHLQFAKNIDAHYNKEILIDGLYNNNRVTLLLWYPFNDPGDQQEITFYMGNHKQATIILRGRELKTVSFDGIPSGIAPKDFIVKYNNISGTQLIVTGDIENHEYASSLPNLANYNCGDIPAPTNITATREQVHIAVSGTCAIGDLTWEGVESYGSYSNASASSFGVMANDPPPSIILGDIKVRCTTGSLHSNWTRITPINLPWKPFCTLLTDNHSTLLISNSQWTGTLQLNKDYGGYALDIGGIIYDNGLGTATNSNIKYNLNSNYINFSGKVGLDDAINGQCGDNKILFEIWSDGIKVWNSPLLGKDDSAYPFSINVTNVDEIELIALMGDGSTACDWANWVDLILEGQPSVSIPSFLSSSPNPVPFPGAASQLSGNCIVGILEWNGLSGASPTIYPTTNSTYQARCNDNGTTSAWVDLEVEVTEVETNCTVNLVDLHNQLLISNSQWTGTLQINKDYGGYSLDIGGETFAKGLGTASVSNIKYNLGGNYLTFSGKVGLDDAIAGQSPCGNNKLLFEIYLDGIKVWNSSLLGKDDLAEAFSLNVSSASELELVVQMGDGSTACDWANWVDLELSCQSFIPSPVNVYSDPATITIQNGSAQLFATCPSGIVEWEGLAGVSPFVSPNSDALYRVRCIENNQVSSYKTITVKVDVSGGCQTNLTSITPISATQWGGTPNMNSDYGGYSLDIGGTTYSTGWGTGTEANIKYDVSAGYGAFTGKVGLDDAIYGQCGDNKVQFEIKGDGQTLWTSNILGQNDNAQPFTVQLSGISQLELVSHMADGSTACDWADWVELILSGCPTPNSRKSQNPISNSSQVELQNNATLSIYPVPASNGVLNYKVDRNFEISEAFIIDNQGRVILSEINPKSYSFNIQNIPSGKYILQLKMKEGILSKGFILR